MTTAQQLANRLKEVLTEGQWVSGTNFKEQILQLDWKEATQKIGALNSIADLTFHTSYYIAGVVQVLEGGPLDIRDKFSFDYAPPTSEMEWQELIHKFCEDSERLINLVSGLSEEQLKAGFVDDKYGDYQRNINVIIEHSYYHLGQLLLIKKML